MKLLRCRAFARRRVPITVAQVLAWADDFHAHTGRWPNVLSGRVRADLNETWHNINQALRQGLRGLPGGDSLARLLWRERGARNRYALPPLTEADVCRWAEAHRRHIGSWPAKGDGAIAGADGEDWNCVNQALRQGLRGLPGGDTLARLLARRLGARNRASAPRLTEAEILAWADAHRRRTGRWPSAGSGPAAVAPGEDWKAIDNSLRLGYRGLPGGSSLARLLAERKIGADPTPGDPPQPADVPWPTPRPLAPRPANLPRWPGQGDEAAEPLARDRPQPGVDSFQPQPDRQGASRRGDPDCQQEWETDDDRHNILSA
jgi:hypothetical protein